MMVDAIEHHLNLNEICMKTFTIHDTNIVSFTDEATVRFLVTAAVVYGKKKNQLLV